jgi:hypothetical protein
VQPKPITCEVDGQGDLEGHFEFRRAGASLKAGAVHRFLCRFQAKFIGKTMKYSDVSETDFSVDSHAEIRHYENGAHVCIKICLTLRAAPRPKAYRRRSF